MRERPGQRCLSSEPASRWRPTRDSTGWKCLQNTLTHRQRKTPLHSCFPAIVCRASSVCIFILHLFIMLYVTFFPISFLLFFNFLQQVAAVESLDAPGWAVVQLSLYLAALMEEQLSRTKEELSGAKAPIALQRCPSEEKPLLFRNQCWKAMRAGVLLPALFSLPCRVHSPILYCRYDADTLVGVMAKQPPWQWSTETHHSPRCSVQSGGRQGGGTRSRWVGLDL